MTAHKCRFCEILKNPRSYFDWIFYQDNICIIGVRQGNDIICIYKVHGELPGGHNLYEMMGQLDKIKDKEKEWLQYVDGSHYRIYIRKKKGDKNARPGDNQFS